MRLKNVGNLLKATDYQSAAYAVDALAKSTKGLTNEQAVNLVMRTSLSNEEKKDILIKAGLTAEEAAAAVATDAHTAATGRATLATTLSTAATAALSTALGVLKGVMDAIAAHPIVAAIAAIIAVLSILITQTQKAKQAAEQAAEEQYQLTKKAADEAARLGDEITNLTDEYLELSKEVKINNNRKTDLIKTENELLKLLGVEQKELDGLIEKYGSVDDAIKAASASALRDSLTDLQSHLSSTKNKIIKAAESETVDVHGGSVPKNMNYIYANSDDKGAFDEGTDGSKALEVLNSHPDFVAENMTGTVGNSDFKFIIEGTDMFGGDLETLEGVLYSHGKLKEALELVAREVGTDNPVYEALNEEYAEVNEKIKEYDDTVSEINETASQLHIYESLIGRDIPTTTTEFEAFRDELIQNAIASKDFVGTQEQIENAINNTLRAQSDFAKFYTSGGGLANYKISFSELIADDDFSDIVDDYIEKINTLKSALESYQDGSFENEDFVELFRQFPELADDTDNLAEAIQTLIETYNGLASDKLGGYAKDLETSEDIAQFNQFMANLLGMSKTGSTEFDSIQKAYEGDLSEFDHLVNTYENAIDAMEKSGLRRTTTYYEKLRGVEQNRITILQNELAALTTEFQNAILSGEVKEGSEEWNKMNSAINKVKESIQKAEIAVQDYSNTIRDIEWEYFDYQQKLNSQVTDESNFLLDLMSGKDMVDDKGAFTDFGNAAMGLHGVNYNVYLKQSQQYATELAKIEAELATNPYNQDLIDRKEELLGLQRDSILAAEDEKQAMIDLVKEGIDAQCDAMKDLIDKYKEALDSAKDLYDYQNKVSDITQEIGTLQKQIIAYENDTSEEAKAQIQQLKVDLQKAQEELQETEYDQFIADQKKLLDRLYNDYEQILNQRLDDVDTLISDCITSINDGATEIQGTLGSLGTTLSSNMSTIWNTAGGVGTVVSTFNEDFDTKMTTVGTILGNIETLVSNIKKNSTNNSTITTNPDNSGGATNPTESEIVDYTPTEIPSTSTGTSSGTGTGTGTGTYDQWSDYWFSQNPGAYGPPPPMPEGWSPPATKTRWTSYQDAADAGYANIRTRTEFGRGNNSDKTNYGTYQAYLDGMYEKYMGKPPAYAEGGLADFTGLAWVDGTKSKPEAFLDAEDTQNIASLRDMLRALASDSIGVSNPLYSMFEPITYQGKVPGLEDKISSLSKHTETINVENHFEITIPIDKVEDYNDFVTKLQSDPKFEKMIEAMTLGRLKGGSPLAKYNYKWK